VIPFFGVGSDELLVVRLDGQKRVYSLNRQLFKPSHGRGYILRTLKGGEDALR
jgi:hypothetical protein